MKIIFTLEDLMFLLAIAIMFIWVGFIVLKNLINSLKEDIKEYFRKNKE